MLVGLFAVDYVGGLSSGLDRDHSYKKIIKLYVELMLALLLII